MNIIESYITKNPCYNTNKNIKVKGLMLHSIGCPQPIAKYLVNNYNKTNFYVAVHAFIDAITGDTYQCLPWSHRAWHCGGYGNDTHIGIEMCEPDCIKYKGTSAIFTCSNLERARSQTMVAYNAAVELFAHLCMKFKLDPLEDGVIISHNEGNKRGIASGHVDPEHLWTQLDMDLTMDKFRKDVYKALTGNDAPENNPEDETLYAIQIGPYKGKSNVEKILKQLEEAGFEGAITTNFDESIIKVDTLEVGDKVKVLKAVDYTGKKINLYFNVYDVLDIKGDRIVIGINGIVTAAINIENLKKVDGSEDIEEVKELKSGDKVKVIKAVDYNGKKLNLYFDSYDIMSINGDRVVIGVNGIVTAAIKKEYLEKI